MSSPVFDLRDLALRVGESAERHLDLEPYPIFIGGQKYEVVPRGGGAALAVKRVNGGYLVTVRIEAMVYGACFRCLREIAQEVRAEQQEFGPANPEKFGDDDMSVFIDDFVVDVEGLAREAVVLGLPDKLLCQAECRGLCPVCGTDLNVEACRCEQRVADPRWDKLRELELAVESDEEQRRETG